MARTRRNKRLRKEREEKLCLNCSTVLHGRFCHVCGQENIEQREPIWVIMLSFIESITFFNSKFFETLIPFIFKPGFLTNEYNLGKRNRYLNPVKMYFFLSFLFFLVFYGAGAKTEVIVYNLSSTVQNDSVSYDSANNTALDIQIPTGIDNWYTRKLAKLREQALKEGNNGVLLTLNQKFLDNIPTVIFLIMPFLALIFKLFFRKKYFIDHLIYSLHIHSFGFFVFLIITFLPLILPNEIKFVAYIGFLLLAIYLFKSIKVVYAQSWVLSITKGLVISLLYSIVFGIGFFINILVAIAVA